MRVCVCVCVVSEGLGKGRRGRERGEGKGSYMGVWHRFTSILRYLRKGLGVILYRHVA